MFAFRKVKEHTHFKTAETPWVGESIFYYLTMKNTLTTCVQIIKEIVLSRVRENNIFSETENKMASREAIVFAEFLTLMQQVKGSIYK